MAINMKRASVFAAAATGLALAFNVSTTNNAEAGICDIHLYPSKGTRTVHVAGDSFRGSFKTSHGISNSHITQSKSAVSQRIPAIKALENITITRASQIEKICRTKGAELARNSDARSGTYGLRKGSCIGDSWTAALRAKYCGHSKAIRMPARRVDWGSRTSSLH